MSSPHIVTETGIVSLISEAGLVAKIVLLALLSASIFCWAIILAKWRGLKRALKENSSFLDTFWHSKNIDEIFLKIDKYPSSPVAAVFKSGVKELRKLTSKPETPNNTVEGVENIYRALVRASNAEMAGLERHVSWLATTASAAPFVGLFGTVWGIMNAFQNIGATGAANLAVVAPGISEALITTATGIGAAIPAVVAYNYFVGQIKKVSVDMECFSQDFLNIINRSVINAARAKPVS